MGIPCSLPSVLTRVLTVARCTTTEITTATPRSRNDAFPLSRTSRRRYCLAYSRLQESGNATALATPPIAYLDTDGNDNLDGAEQ